MQNSEIQVLKISDSKYVFYKLKSMLRYKSMPVQPMPAATHFASSHATVQPNIWVHCHENPQAPANGGIGSIDGLLCITTTVYVISLQKIARSYGARPPRGCKPV